MLALKLTVSLRVDLDHDTHVRTLYRRTIVKLTAVNACECAINIPLTFVFDRHDKHSQSMCVLVCLPGCDPGLDRYPWSCPWSLVGLMKTLPPELAVVLWTLGLDDTRVNVKC